MMTGATVRFREFVALVEAAAAAAGAAAGMWLVVDDCNGDGSGVGGN